MNKTLAGIGWFFFGCFLVSLFEGVTLPGGMLAVSSAACLSAAYQNVRYALIALVGFLGLGLSMAYHEVQNYYYDKGYQKAVLETAIDNRISEAMSNAVNITAPIKKKKSDEEEAEHD